MAFNFKLMFKLVYKSLFASKRTNARLTPKRLGIILILFPSYILIEITNWIGFLLDEIFFREYRQVEVKEPVFILGIPRSGTTFLHRLLAKDKERFTSMKLWELAFAPSIIQKKFWIALGRLDRQIGSPVVKRIVSCERWLFEKFRGMHKTSLFEPEEDEFMLVHIFSSSFLYVVFPFDDDLQPFMRFDEELSPTHRARIMAFYKKCVQRHLFVFGRGKRFLAKNPSFSFKVRSIGETFPDAQIVCMVRTPFQVIPSTVSLLSHYFSIFTSPIEPYPMRESIYRITLHWYRYPINQLEEWPQERHAIIKYGTLVQNSEQTVLNLYERFGFNMHPRFRQVLQEEAEKARQYKSQHVYSLEQTGLTREKVVSDYKDIFERFGFDTMEGDATRNF